MIMSLIVSGTRNSRLLAVLLASTLSFGCDTHPGGYIVLGEARVLEYDVRLEVNEEVSQQKIIFSDRRSTVVNGRRYYPGISASGKTYYRYLTDAGVYSTRDPDEEGVLLMPAAPEPGQQWQSPTRIHILDNRHETFAGGDTFISVDKSLVIDHIVQRLDAVVSVPAGRYDHCLEIHSTATVPVEARTSGIESIVIEQTEWYAPGTGLVKRIRTESTVPSKIRGSLVQELAAIL